MFHLIHERLAADRSARVRRHAARDRWQVDRAAASQVPVPRLRRARAREA